MIENWSKPGMPPEFYDVLNRVTNTNPESGSTTEFIWLSGAHPQKGTVIPDGWQGVETVVELYLYPGAKPRFIRDYVQELPVSHPLHDWQLRRHNKEVVQIPVFED